MKNLIWAMVVSCLGLPLAAQTGVALGGLKLDPKAPIETRADSLRVNRDTKSSVFEGNVVIGQGNFRLAAQRVEIASTDSGISKISASGGVTFTTQTDAIEARSAEYSLSNGTLIMRGSVLLSQGQSAIMGDSVRINLRNGSAVFEGNVRTILQTGSGN